MKTKPIPDGFGSAIPYLICKDAAKAIEFYKKAFDATEIKRIAMPDGRVGHAELKISHATIMLADEFPDMGTVSPPIARRHDCADDDLRRRRGCVRRACCRCRRKGVEPAH